MQIVIDIPEDVRNRVAFGITYRQDLQIIGDAIANSIPLPKGHGNLVDIDRLFDMIYNPRDGILEIYKDRPRAQLENELESVFDHTPIIIEADKE